MSKNCFPIAIHLTEAIENTLIRGWKVVTHTNYHEVFECGLGPPRAERCSESDCQNRLSLACASV